MAGVLIWRYDAGRGVIRAYDGAKSNILDATHHLGEVEAG